ncbi:hypothetical protein QC764_310780 [Podospora pseudoanserina]|uniref:Uncharacterized protein n=1 Tax=Podospora pseudoanserina TaxID=2609844 RepID=A0ABR0IFG9_9PEZI|nr:hypothetical protein QC764_310780 [Podospora pseudoanserina]
MPQVCPQLPYLWLLFGNPFPLEQPARPDIPFSKTPQHFPETNINNNNPEHWIQLPESMNWSGEKAPVLSSLPNLPTRLLQQPLPTYLRYVHRTDAFTALIFIAGTCLDRRTPDPKAGWALGHARAPDYPKLSLLAWKGRGLLATMAPRPATGRSFALRFEFGPNEEGFRTLVIAVNSKYVVEGSTT